MACRKKRPIIWVGTGMQLHEWVSVKISTTSVVSFEDFLYQISISRYSKFLKKSHAQSLPSWSQCVPLETLDQLSNTFVSLVFTCYKSGSSLLQYFEFLCLTHSLWVPYRTAILQKRPNQRHISSFLNIYRAIPKYSLDKSGALICHPCNFSNMCSPVHVIRNVDPQVFGIGYYF